MNQDERVGDEENIWDNYRIPRIDGENAFYRFYKYLMRSVVCRVGVREIQQLSGTIADSSSAAGRALHRSRALHIF